VVRVRQLTIDFPAMPHAVNPHLAGSIIDFINDPVISDPDAPVILAPDQLAAARRAGNITQGSDSTNDAIVKIRRKPVQVLFGGSFE
jgi:hypothetical protein